MRNEKLNQEYEAAKKRLFGKEITVPTFDEILERAPQHIKDLYADLEDLGERKDYHPEDSTSEHIRIVTERLRETNDMTMVMSGLFHDLGKYIAAKREKQNNFVTEDEDWLKRKKNAELKSYGHEFVGAKLVRENFAWILDMGAEPDDVEEIVANHMRIKQMHKMKKTKQELMKQLKNYERLLVFSRADNMLEEFKL